MTDPVTRLDRRAFLTTALGAGVAGLAGCASRNEDDPESPTADGFDPFGWIDVAEGVLAVQLTDESVTGVNLIGPDGTLFGRQSVATGVSIVRFQLIELELGQSIHYTPGEYKLVAERGEESASHWLKLRPDLRIREIKQYRVEDEPASYGHLSVQIENVGNAPTWIYEIAYDNPPSRGANDKINQFRDIPTLKHPEKIEDLILSAGETKSYIELDPALRFVEESGQSCGGSIETTMLIGTGHGEPLEQPLRLHLGESVSIGAIGQFVCSDVTVDRLNASDKQNAALENR